MTHPASSFEDPAAHRWCQPRRANSAPVVRMGLLDAHRSSQWLAVRPHPSASVDTHTGQGCRSDATACCLPASVSSFASPAGLVLSPQGKEGVQTPGTLALRICVATAKRSRLFCRNLAKAATEYIFKVLCRLSVSSGLYRRATRRQDPGTQPFSPARPPPCGPPPASAACRRRDWPPARNRRGRAAPPPAPSACPSGTP
jgi:hypothetical protein